MDLPWIIYIPTGWLLCFLVLPRPPTMEKRHSSRRKPDAVCGFTSILRRKQIICWNVRLSKSLPMWPLLGLQLPSEMFNKCFYTSLLFLRRNQNHTHLPLSPLGESQVNPSLLNDLSSLPRQNWDPCVSLGRAYGQLVRQPCSMQTSIFYDWLRTMLYQLNTLIIISACGQSRTFFRCSLCSRMISSVGEITACTPSNCQLLQCHYESKKYTQVS